MVKNRFFTNASVWITTICLIIILFLTISNIRLLSEINILRGKIYSMYMCLPGRTESDIVSKWGVGPPDKIIYAGGVLPKASSGFAPTRKITNKVLIYKDTYIYIGKDGLVEALYFDFGNYR
jgi:hypothetical protein